MTKPKIEDFIPPRWFAAMEKKGEVLITRTPPAKTPSQWIADFPRTRIAKEHAAMFDLSIFGPDWEKSLWQKPPELQQCPVCGGSVVKTKNHVECIGPCRLIGPSQDTDGSKWNRLRYEEE